MDKQNVWLGLLLPFIDDKMLILVCIHRIGGATENVSVIYLTVNQVVALQSEALNGRALCN